jgi:hypothetical protein
VHDHRQIFNVFNSSIGSEKTNESNGNYKKEACVARKHLKKEVLKTRGSEEADVIRNTLLFRS